jgi:hypothetical protein
MAALTTEQLLSELQQACYRSALVDHVETRVIDADTLSVRVHLARAETFINAFYNVSTDKTAFALVEGGQRIYGVDNAKMGWHEHPFHHPTKHANCAPVEFAEFLARVEEYYQVSAP